jgi:phosphohistidine phosphatase SixA
MNTQTVQRARFFALLLAIGVIARPPAATPTFGRQSDLANVEVLIVRHAERQGEDDELTPAGVARADAYAGYFKTLKLEGRSIHLTHLFAEQSKRTTETLEPLSKAMGLPLDQRFTTKQYPELADDLRTHAYGNEILICWHHSKMPGLITALGGNPEGLLPGGKWPDTTYDWLIDLRFDAAGKLAASDEKCVHEHLMPGDSK